MSTEDIEHLETFKEHVSSKHPIKVYKGNSFGKEVDYCRIIITSRKIVEDLIKLGVHENKTTILTFPDERVVPKNLLNHFIRGYMDGDGSIVQPKSEKYQLTFCGTMEFLNGIQDALGINVKLIKRHKNKVNNYTLMISGNLQVERLLEYIYQNSSVYLERKYKRFLDLKNKNKLLYK